jgi:hypothetical protein
LQREGSVAILKASACPFLLEWTIAAYPPHSKLHFDFTIDFLEIEMYIMRKDGACSGPERCLPPRAARTSRSLLRLGTLHRQIETLLGSGRMPLDRVVVEASAFSRQGDVVALMAESGRELILDTNVAELSAIGRYGGAARAAPWGPCRCRATS